MAEVLRAATSKDRLRSLDTAGRMEAAGEWIGKLGLLVFSLGLVGGVALISSGAALMLLGFALVLRDTWRGLLQDRLFRLSLGYYAYLLVAAVWASGFQVERLAAHLDGAGDYAQVGFFAVIIVAFWWARLSAEGKLLWPLWALVIGFFLRLLRKWPVEDWSNGIPWKLGFGMYYNPFGLFCALVAAWWLVLLLDRLFKGNLRATVGIVSALSVPILGLIYSASRGAIVAFIVGLFVILILSYRAQSTYAAPWKLRTLYGVVAAVLVLGMLAGPVAKRDPGSWTELSRILDHGISQFSPQGYTSTGTRAVIWREGINLWLDKPLIGHGPAPVDAFMADIKDRFDLRVAFDFENTYIEMLVRLGLFGAIFFLAHAALCVASFRRGLHMGLYPRFVSDYLVAAIVIFGVALFFREGLIDQWGRGMASFLLAGMYIAQAGNLMRTPDASIANTPAVNGEDSGGPGGRRKNALHSTGQARRRVETASALG